MQARLPRTSEKKNISICSGVGYSSEMMPEMPFDEWVDRSEEYLMEAGDILWQLAGLCNVMGWKLDDVAQRNLEKLASRKQRGVIDGDGDNR